MGSSIVLSTSRQVFAFSRDGALPFSSVLYRMNDYTKTPVNSELYASCDAEEVPISSSTAVWFSVFIAALLGLLCFAGEAAIGAVFSVSS